MQYHLGVFKLNVDDHAIDRTNDSLSAGNQRFMQVVWNNALTNVCVYKASSFLNSFCKINARNTTWQLWCLASAYNHLQNTFCSRKRFLQYLQCIIQSNCHTLSLVSLVEFSNNSLVLHCASLLRTIFASILARANERVRVQNLRDFPQAR